MGNPPTITKIVEKKAEADFTVTIFPIRHLRDEVLENLPALSRNQWLAHACTTKRFPSSRCASATKIVRPLESIAETQPQLQPALLRLSAMISQYFTRSIAILR